MKRLVFYSTAATALLLANVVLAQTPPARNEPGNNPINSRDKNSSVPVVGANSFTEGQAKSRIEEAGFAGVTDLRKDDNGVWRGKASKGGAATDVSIDFQGNVNAAKK